MNNNPKVDIVILNWNGWKDTVECIDSLFKQQYTNYRIVIVDNGSTDHSIEYITNWAHQSLIEVVDYDIATAQAGGTVEQEEYLSTLSSNSKLVLIRSGENLGFAKGCNIGIHYSLATKSHYIWFLNNDTIVEPDALQILIEFMNTYIDYVGVTPQIRYYDKPDYIWNCGGHIKWYGVRKYDFANQLYVKAPKDGHKQITFATGCALLIRMKAIEQVGMLSESFFFGEEDFEWGLRLKKHRLKQACCYNAVIYHKVGQSIDRTTEQEIRKVYVYYLNRFINLRKHYSCLLWQNWRHLYMIYIVFLLKKRYKVSLSTIGHFIWSLRIESRELNGVDKEKFNNIMKSKHF